MSSCRLIAALALSMLFACGASVQRYPAPPAPTRADTATYDRLLATYVGDNGLVDYDRWKTSEADIAAFDRFLGQLTSASPDSAPALFDSGAQRLSYWVNLYNAIVLREVLRRWPIESVRKVRGGATSYVAPGRGFFADLRVLVGGKEMSLDDIEHEVLRRRFDDARIHFAINCGSSSCPILRKSSFDPATIDQELERAALTFINDPANLTVVDDAKAVRVSKLFKWYRDDFIALARARTKRPTATLYDFLLLYARGDLELQLRGAQLAGYEVRFRDYDWSINRQDGSAPPPTPPTSADAEAVGERMPAIDIPLLDGTSFSPASTRGKVVLIDVWATWCAPCREIMPELERLHRAHAADGLLIVAISQDESRELVEEFVSRLGLSFAIGLDLEQQLAGEPLTITQLPTEILIDRRGRIRYRHDGVAPGQLEVIERQLQELLAESP